MSDSKSNSEESIGEIYIPEKFEFMYWNSLEDMKKSYGYNYLLSGPGFKDYCSEKISFVWVTDSSIIGYIKRDTIIRYIMIKMSFTQEKAEEWYTGIAYFCSAAMSKSKRNYNQNTIHIDVLNDILAPREGATDIVEYEANLIKEICCGPNFKCILN